jgi:hypothetical protein
MPVSYFFKNLIAPIPIVNTRVMVLVFAMIVLEQAAYSSSMPELVIGPSMTAVFFPIKY